MWRFHRKGLFPCLRRILLCAWTTRQRTFSPIPRARFVSSRPRPRMRQRQKSAVSVPARLSRTGSSSYEIRVCGTSAYVDSLTNRSAIVRVCDDARMQRFSRRLLQIAVLGQPIPQLSVERIVAQAYLRARHFPLPDDGHAVDARGGESLAELECEVGGSQGRLVLHQALEDVTRPFAVEDALHL